MADTAVFHGLPIDGIQEQQDSVGDAVAAVGKRIRQDPDTTRQAIEQANGRETKTRAKNKMGFERVVIFIPSSVQQQRSKRTTCQCPIWERLVIQSIKYATAHKLGKTKHTSLA